MAPPLKNLWMCTFNNRVRFELGLGLSLGLWLRLRLGFGNYTIFGWGAIRNSFLEKNMV